MSRTTEAPDDATLTPTQTADLCDSFCSHVCTFLSTLEWQHEHDQRMKPIPATPHCPAILPPEPGSPAYENHMKEFKRLHDVICQARHDFAEVEGPMLAAALERFGLDSTPVLSIINAHNPTGGGIEQMRDGWQDKRVALQRAALKLRNLDGPSLSPDTDHGDGNHGHEKDGGSLLSSTQLADRFGVPRDALRKRLDRWRYKHDDGWTETLDRKCRGSKYIYRLSSVIHVIEDLKTSVQRPPRKT